MSHSNEQPISPRPDSPQNTEVIENDSRKAILERMIEEDQARLENDFRSRNVLAQREDLHTLATELIPLAEDEQTKNQLITLRRKLYPESTLIGQGQVDQVRDEQLIDIFRELRRYLLEIRPGNQSTEDFISDRRRQNYIAEETS